MSKYSRTIAFMGFFIASQACGTQSQASLDCETFVKAIPVLESGFYDTSAQPVACDVWLEAAPTRCQSAFRALAVCLRQQQDGGHMSLAACTTELSEYLSFCADDGVASVLQENAGRTDTNVSL